jgi:restriction system protein
MAGIYCVRAEGGKYAEAFRSGGYAAYAWEKSADLSRCTTKEQIQARYVDLHPHQANPHVAGQHVGNMVRLLLDMRSGDFVFTPTLNSDQLIQGVLRDAPYQYVEGDPACPLQHRRPVEWSQRVLQRSELSIPFQYALRAWQTVFSISDADQRNSFLQVIGHKPTDEPTRDVSLPYHRAVLKRVLELDAHDFELLITNLLRAAGFEAEHEGRPGDGGVDAQGEMDIYGMARVKVHAQAKRYQLGAKVGASEVKALRASIPQGAQGVFITTGEFHRRAREIALEPGFPRIGTIDGEQLVELLTVHWGEIDEQLRQKLRLRPGLLPE